MTSKSKTRSKYNVSKDKKKRTYDSITFDSELEMRYYRDVIIPKYNKGEIVDYQLQKPYILQQKFVHNGKTIQPIKYVADFYIEYKDGHKEVIDIKGMPDSVAILKRKMFWFTFPTLEYKWVCYSKIDGGFCEYEYVKEKRKERKKSKESK